MIVNELKEAGAEAISINDERIINMTDIVSVNENTVIRVNQQRVVSPYVIKSNRKSNIFRRSNIRKWWRRRQIRKIGTHSINYKIKQNTNKKYNKALTTKYIKED